MCSKDNVKIINIDEPFDQDSYWGRVRSLVQRHNPFNLFVFSSRLEDAKCLYLKYRCGEPLPEYLSEDELWRSKFLFDSAYNPKTGEKINFLARPSAYIPMNALLAGGMMAYCRSTPGTILWQWLNQTYNAFVSYSNRAGEKEVTDNQLMTSYVLATSTAVATALGLNRALACSPSLMGRFVPLAAVVAAHCVNIPLMKAQELRNGVPVYDECDHKLGYSKHAAQARVGDTILNKIAMAVPPLLLTPFFINSLERRGTLCRYPWINFPGHAVFAGLCLTFLTPLAGAFFANKALIPYKHLELDLREGLCKKFKDRPPKYLYYHKELF